MPLRFDKRSDVLVEAFYELLKIEAAMFEDLDPLLHSQVRLSIMSLLMRREEADFNFLLEKTAASAVILNVEILKLAQADYIIVKKTFVNNDPQTSCKITVKGIHAFDKYVSALQNYIQKN